MKATGLFILSMLTTLSLFGQDFEGKIIYTNSFKSKNQKVTDQQWNSMMGNVSEYYIKSGNYKSITNGRILEWQLYNSKGNKLYNKMSSSPTIFWNDGSINSDSVLKAEVNPSVMEILGYKCDELILTCKSGVQKYYFHSAIAANPSLFVEHKYGNWFDYLSRAKALPLKAIIENEQFIMETIATEVKPMNLDSKLFELPSDAKIEKSPY